MDQISFPTKITKDELKKIIDLRGSRNGDDLQIGADVYAAGSLVFCGFAGGLSESEGLYVGDYKFRMAQPSDDERNLICFSKLLGQDTSKLAVEEPAAGEAKKTDKAKKKKGKV